MHHPRGNSRVSTKHCLAIIGQRRPSNPRISPNTASILALGVSGYPAEQGGRTPSMYPAFMSSPLPQVSWRTYATHHRAHHPCYGPRHSSTSIYGEKSPSTQNELPAKSGKRFKEYFFKLLFAARNRDGRLLKAVLRALSQDEEFRRSRLDLKPGNLLQIDDVLLKAASRCGQIALADKVFRVWSAIVFMKLF